MRFGLLLAVGIAACGGDGAAGVASSPPASSPRGAGADADASPADASPPAAEEAAAPDAGPTACVDECVLGARDAGALCKLWDDARGAFVSPSPETSLHDRARDYERLLYLANMPDGQVMNADYADPARTQLSHYDGYHDAAIWTGTALAAQAWRLQATGELDARAQVAALVQTLHRDFVATGDPGYLARVVLPPGSTTTLDDPDPCKNDPEWHCGAQRWLGATSRDQYTGVLLGYALAYLATTDDAVKQAIRSDIVAVAQELMKSRTGVPASILVDGVPLNMSLDLENVILAPSEMQGGRVTITLDTKNASDAHIVGMREFFPDYGALVKQAIGLALPIPRPSTAIMLGAIFQIALLVTDGVPGLEATHQAFADYYAAHASGWLDIAAGWSFDANCGGGYFANHLAFIMAHVYALLEKSPTLLPRVRDQVLDGKIWAALRGHKNAYFAFLWGATRSAPPKPDIDAALIQLAQFSPGPRVHAARDVSALYTPHDAKCTSPVLCDTATLAVDVKDRVVDDFIWQRQPWQLVDPGNPLQVYPGVDYLAAYWAARRHGFLADDRPRTCTRYDR